MSRAASIVVGRGLAAAPLLSEGLTMMGDKLEPLRLCIRRGFGAVGFPPDVLAVADELRGRLSEDELRALAVALPFHVDAWDAIAPGIGRRDDVRFAQWVNGAAAVAATWSNPARGAVKPAAADQVALYCALACRHAVSKTLTALVELSRRKLALLDAQNQVLQLVQSKGCALTRAAMLGHGGRDAIAAMVGK